MSRRIRRSAQFSKRKMQLERLENRQLLAADFSLELLHFSDQEAGASAVVDAPNLSAVLNALRAEDLGSDGVADNTLTLSSGDAIIPGLFFDASESVFGSAGVADIEIQNELGVQAMALGNHEFDLGTGTLAGLISGSSSAASDGTDFPYLSSNLDFGPDANLSPLVAADAAPPVPGSVAASTVIDVNGELIGIVGATTPILDVISSPGNVGISPSPFGGVPSASELDALASEIQTDVDALLAANPSVDKVVLLAHMQQINIEQELAQRLQHVDIIVAGGSNTRLFDSNDVPRAGDSVQGSYPIFETDAVGNTVAVVNTDGNYKYVGRLVMDFDASGNLIPTSYDPTVSGVYATDDAGVAALGAAGLVDPEVQTIADEIRDVIVAQDANFFGITTEFLNANRSGGGLDGVRTQETNLGNLTADANLAAAKAADPTVMVSIKNGGGIRANIGEIVVPAGGTEPVRLPPAANPISGRPEGGISQNAIQSTLAFNNGLSLLTLTRTELLAVLEHAVAASSADPNNAQGRFPQIAGINFSFDVDLPSGDRVVSAAIVDESGNLISELARDGELVGDPAEQIRIVTLGFLAGGGDGFPFPSGPAANRVDLKQDTAAPRTGVADFAVDGSEQDALAEYLAANFSAPTPYSEADTDQSADTRTQNLDFRADTVIPSKIRGRSIWVTNELDSGVGSLRNALLIASSNSRIKKIRFERDVNTIVVDSQLEYSGAQDLEIRGSRVTVQAGDNFTGEALLASSGGADLRISKLTLDGDFDSGETPAHGLYVPVPADATGTVEVRLEDVNVRNTGLFGVFVADQLNNSDASIRMHLEDVLVTNSGIGALDFDGVRVDEGGLGSIYTYINDTSIDANGGDGLELDERGDGNVYMRVFDSTFNRNGFFDVEDLDDGLDIDEAGPGSVYAYLKDVDLSDNFDEGLDLDEEDEGALSLIAYDISVNRNLDEGIKLSEEDAGNVSARLFDVEANENGDDGIELEEEGSGSAFFNLKKVEAEGNGDSGFQVEEAGDGSLFGNIWWSSYDDNEGNGIQLEESGEGNFRAYVFATSATGNAEYGIEAKQEDEGRGLLYLFGVDLRDNGLGAYDVSGIRKRGR